MGYQTQPLLLRRSVYGATESDICFFNLRAQAKAAGEFLPGSAVTGLQPQRRNAVKAARCVPDLKRDDDALFNRQSPQKMKFDVWRRFGEEREWQAQQRDHSGGKEHKSCFGHSNCYSSTPRTSIRFAAIEPVAGRDVSAARARSRQAKASALASLVRPARTVSTDAWSK